MTNAKSGAFDGLIAGVCMLAPMLYITHLETNSLDAKMRNIRGMLIPCAVCILSGVAFGASYGALSGSPYNNFKPSMAVSGLVGSITALGMTLELN